MAWILVLLETPWAGWGNPVLAEATEGWGDFSRDPLLQTWIIPLFLLLFLKKNSPSVHFIPMTHLFCNWNFVHLDLPLPFLSFPKLPSRSGFSFHLFCCVALGKWHVLWAYSFSHLCNVYEVIVRTDEALFTKCLAQNQCMTGTQSMVAFFFFSLDYSQGLSVITPIQSCALVSPLFTLIPFRIIRFLICLVEYLAAELC